MGPLKVVIVCFVMYLWSAEDHFLLSSWPVWQNTEEGLPSSYEDSKLQTRLCKTITANVSIPLWLNDTGNLRPADNPAKTASSNSL